MDYEVKLIDKYSSITLFVKANNPSSALNQFFEYFRDKINEVTEYEVEITPVQFSFSNIDVWKFRKN